MVEDITYALAKKVPDMRQRGFTIETAYGEIYVPSGDLADRLAKVVSEALTAQLNALEHAKAAK